MIYRFLNLFFYFFHTLLIFFILLGWTLKKTRFANLIVILLTAFSWVVLGIWYGFGYCPSTDWHWEVRMKLGHHELPSSYTKFLVDSLTGWEVKQKTMDIVAVFLLGLSFFSSLFLNLRDRRKKRAEESVS